MSNRDQESGAGMNLAGANLIRGAAREAICNVEIAA